MAIVRKVEYTIEKIDIFSGIATNVGDKLPRILTELNKDFDVDIKKNPSARSIRITIDNQKQKCTEIESIVSEYQKIVGIENMYEAFFVVLLKIIKTGLTKGRNSKSKDRSEKYENMVQHSRNAMDMYIYICCLFTYKEYKKRFGSTGSIYLDKRLEALDINKNKMTRISKLFRKGIIGEREYKLECYDIINDYVKSGVNLSQDELTEIGEIKAKYSLLGKITVDNILSSLSERCSALSLGYITEILDKGTAWNETKEEFGEYVEYLEELFEN